MFVYMDVTSNGTIISPSSMGPFLIQLENLVEFLAFLFLSLTLKRMLAMRLLTLYYGHNHIRCPMMGEYLSKRSLIKHTCL